MFPSARKELRYSNNPIVLLDYRTSLYFIQHMYFQARHDQDVQAAATKGGKNDKQGQNGGKGGNNTTV
uniref:Putative ovule protein n=1 Tax=Solanum chacoense TaxID=4108 RepID=A0A0V0I614_SOLCH